VNSGSYSQIDRIVHKIVLGSSTVQRMSFDFETQAFAGDRSCQGARRAVFVTGLARSGTTTLLRLLYETGEFHSLTYRDMPFVLMPRLWTRFSQPGQKAAVAAERAHGDSVLVDFDSPEGFECVFWRTLSGEAYSLPDCLIPHDPPADVLDKFRSYISIIAERTPEAPRRYLSKNNNNLIRLNALRKSLPDAVILAMYRDPLQTAISSHRQHLRFCEAQTQDAFVLQYMNWLEHHEFGLGHKPFRFGPAALSGFNPSEPNYWLNYWIQIYEHLLSTDTSFHLVNYETFCATPLPALSSLFSVLELNSDPVDFSSKFRLASTSRLPAFDSGLARRAAVVYQELCADRRNVC